MRAAGIAEFAAPIELLDLPVPDELRIDEVLLDVRGCGLGNWDDVVRNGYWDLGRKPPMALGVEAAGVVTGIGVNVSGLRIGDRVMTHSVPLRDQGAWAESFVAAAADVALIPETVPFNVAAAFPIPALTADQVLRDTLDVRPGSTLLVHGAGGVTGLVIAQLAAHFGVEVIATAGSHSAESLAAAPPAHVIDRHAPDLADQVGRLTGGHGADFAVNTVQGDADRALAAVKDGGRFATITSDSPAAVRSIEVTQVYVAPDGPRLAELGELLASGAITLTVGAEYPLERAADALAHVLRGTNGQAVVLEPNHGS
ncbi:MAG TPA: NADP-dependent oxidoreductase [Micromonosporaceae bacterium]